MSFLLAFMVTPVGALFGTSFANHARWAAKGFGEPLAYTLFLAGLVLIVPPRLAAEPPSGRIIATATGASGLSSIMTERLMVTQTPRHAAVQECAVRYNPARLSNH